MKNYKRKKFLICLLLSVIIGISVITFLVSRSNKQKSENKQTKNQKRPSQNPDNINEQRQNFLKNELEKLPDWEKLSPEEQNELKNDCEVSQPQQFPNILDKAKTLLAKKGQGGEEPNPKPGKNPNEDEGNNPNPKTNGQNNEVNKPTNDWATKIDWTAIKPTQREKEYVGGQILPISSVGTEYRDCYKLDNMLPRGSTLLTESGTGELKNSGIESIIHAAPGSTVKKHENEYHPVYKGILRAIQNAIILAERENYDKIAIPFISGDFWDMLDDIEAAAKAIIYGALNQREKLKEIIFVLSPADKRQDRHGTEFKFIDYFRKYFTEYQQEHPDQAKFGKMMEGDIRNFSIHGAKVIVNDANMEMEWTAGISELIKQKISNYQEIQNKAQGLIGKFNSSPSSPPPTNNNQPKLEFEVWFSSMFIVPKNYPTNLNDYYGFMLLNQLPGTDASDNINWFIVSRKHPVVSTLYSESKLSFSKNHPYKLTILQKDRNKEIFEVDDFFGLEPKK